MQRDTTLRHPEVFDALSRLRAITLHRGLDWNEVERTAHWAAEKHGPQRRRSGEPYITHPLEVACMVADLGGRLHTVQAALLHDTVEDTSATLSDIMEHFSPDVARIVDGCTKVALVHPDASSAQRQAHNLRKLFIALADDPRVIVVKLCDRLHNLRTINALPPEKARRIGSETLAVHAPIAHRLGLGAVKAELEDRAFAAADPDQYNRLAGDIAGDKELHAILEEARTALESHLHAAGLPGTVSGRVKHLWSLHRKAQRMDIPPEEVPDLLGLRVICAETEDCYRVLDAVHHLWEPDVARLKDYISRPKFNSYQSLHTTVTGPRGRRLEIQVRTRGMHEIAEHGAAAHHSYKHGSEPQWIDRLLSWADETDDEEYLADVAHELQSRREILALTPKDTVITLPEGATVIDFAYAIHSDIGDSCTGARIDGKIAPLDTRLRSGQRVEIITGNRQGPSPAWLEHAVTGRARTRIRRHLHPRTTTDAPLPAPSTVAVATPAPVKVHQSQRAPHLVLQAAGLAGVEIRAAGCCKPGPADHPIGITSTGRLSVHRSDCATLARVLLDDPGRRVNVYWTEVQHIVETLDIAASNRHGLLAEIAAAARTIGGAVLRADQQDGHILVDIDVNATRRQRLRAALRLVDGVSAVH